MTAANEDLDLFRDMIVRAFEQEVAPHYEKWEKDGEAPRSLWNTLGSAGLLCVDLDEKYGAAGADFEVSQILLQETARMGFGGLTGGLNIHSNIVAPYIDHIGSEQQKDYWLPKMVTGEAVGAIAMTEPGAGSDLAGMRTSAVRDGDDWVINGSKTFITNGLQAGLVIVCAKTDPAAGSKGISLFIVDTSIKGFARGNKIEKIGQHAGDTAELFFEDMRVPHSAMLGDEGKGFVYLMQELPRERLGVASQSMGAADGAMALTIDYVKERKAFGQSIAQFQNTRFKLAELKTQMELCRSYIEQCKVRYREGKMTTEEASILKLSATQMECRVVDECLQLFGGYGYTLEYPISRFYVDARVQTIYAGTSEIMKEVISRGMVGRG
jgi:acyl-CoA dehydrogenase